MQLQHMRMLDQFENGNLPLNLVGGTKEEKRKRISQRRYDSKAQRSLSDTGVKYRE